MSDCHHCPHCDLCWDNYRDYMNHFRQDGKLRFDTCNRAAYAAAWK